MHVKTKPRASACHRLTLSLAKLTTPSTSTPSISNIDRVLTISSGVALQHGRGHRTTTAHCIASRSCAVAADMLPTAVSTTGRCTGMIYACILAFNASVMLLKSTGIHTLPVRCRCPSVYRRAWLAQDTTCTGTAGGAEMLHESRAPDRQSGRIAQPATASCR